MPDESMRQEMTMLLRRSLWLDIAAFLVSIIVLGVTLRFALGLLLGTAVLFATLLLLQISVKRMAQDARRSGVTSQRRYLMFYALRLLVFGIAFAASLLFPERLHPVAVALPMLYPRIIYTGGAIFHKSGLSSDGKRGE